jgi:hypothetical protein
VHAGDLDGDGDDELVIDVPEARDGAAALARGSAAAMPTCVAGLRPLMVTDLDGDGTAELVAAVTASRGGCWCSGPGRRVLPPVPPDEAELRPVPPGISDPVIATAWRRAEQLVAIGLPRRTAAELAAIAGLAGPVAPDMLLRTGELYARSARTRGRPSNSWRRRPGPDIAPAALAGAAQARRGSASSRRRRR